MEQRTNLGLCSVWLGASADCDIQDIHARSDRFDSMHTYSYNARPQPMAR
jgi:hypothetical protein